MLKHHYSALLTFSPMLKLHCSTLFLPIPKTLQSTISSPSFIDETTPSSNCFAFPILMLKHHYSALLTFSPMLKHHCSTLFLPIPKTLQSTISSPSFIDETTPSNNCFAFSFSVAETPLSATRHHFLFPLLKHHCQQPFIIFSDAETPLFTLDFFTMLKHHSPALLTFFRC
jgi:hypothetical protein